MEGLSVEDAKLNRQPSFPEPRLNGNNMNPRLAFIAEKEMPASLDGRTLNDPEHLLKEEREATCAAVQEPEVKSDDFPDGGLRAWLIVFGVSVTTDDLVYCLG